MAFTRKFLSGLGLSAEQVDAVMEEHVDVVNGLRAFKEKAEQYDQLKNDLDDANKKLSASEDWEKKYNDEHKAFSDYKTDTEKKAVTESKKALYTELLKAEKIDEKRIPSILKVTDFDSIEIKDGKLRNEADLKNAIKTDYSGFIVTTETKGSEVETPPAKDENASNASYIKNFVSSRRNAIYGVPENKEGK